MTVSTEVVQNGPYFPNGVSFVFPFTFRALSPDEVQVVAVSPSGDESIFSSSLYDVQLFDTNGSVTFIVPPASSTVPIFVRSNPAFDQQISFENEGAFLPEVITEALDRSAVRDIWLRDRLGRAILVPAGFQGVTFGTAARGILGIFDGVVSLTPLLDVIATASDLVDDGAWGEGFTDDGVWG